jgi:hypothetical protein
LETLAAILVGKYTTYCLDETPFRSTPPPTTGLVQNRGCRNSMIQIMTILVEAKEKENF